MNNKRRFFVAGACLAAVYTGAPGLRAAADILDSGGRGK